VVVSNRIWPTKMPGFSGLVDFVISSWAFDVQGVVVGIRTYFTPVEETGFLIDGDSVRVSQALDEDFRASALRAFWIQVSLRYRITSVLSHLDLQDLSSEIVGVAGAS